MIGVNDHDLQRSDDRAPRARPRLLVSVRDADEAEVALAGGADWIDLKEPLDGPLGAVSATRAREVVQCVAGRAPTSAAAGELADWPHAASRELCAVEGVSLIKLGLAGCRGTDWRSRWRQAQHEIAAAGKQLVAAAYADHDAAQAPPPAAVLELAIQAHCPWVLVDTFDKRGGPLGDHLAPRELEAWLALARTACRTAVAGRLDRAAICRLPWELVDVVAVRGAACDGPRQARVDRERVAALAKLFPQSATTPAAWGAQGFCGPRRGRQT